jgi:hypothetical protein
VYGEELARWNPLDNGLMGRGSKGPYEKLRVRGSNPLLSTPLRIDSTIGMDRISFAYILGPPEEVVGIVGSTRRLRAASSKS